MKHIPELRKMPIYKMSFALLLTIWLLISCLLSAPGLAWGAMPATYSASFPVPELRNPGDQAMVQLDKNAPCKCACGKGYSGMVTLFFAEDGTVGYTKVADAKFPSSLSGAKGYVEMKVYLSNTHTTVQIARNPYTFILHTHTKTVGKVDFDVKLASETTCAVADDQGVYSVIKIPLVISKSGHTVLEEQAFACASNGPSFRLSATKIGQEDDAEDDGDYDDAEDDFDDDEDDGDDEEGIDEDDLESDDVRTLKASLFSCAASDEESDVSAFIDCDLACFGTLKSEYQVQRSNLCTSGANGYYYYNANSCAVFILSHDVVKLESTGATCYEPGKATFYCNHCNKRWTEVKSAPYGHSLVYHSAKAATCTTAGNRAYYQCSRCKDCFSSKYDAALTVRNYGVSDYCDEEECDWEDEEPDLAKKASYFRLKAYGHSKISGVCKHCGKVFSATSAKMSAKTISSKSRTATLTWTKKSGVSGYQVAYKQGNGKWEYVTVSSSAAFKKIGGLTKGATVSMKVRFVLKSSKTNKTNYGVWSAIKSCKVR